jgi:segregation and condensation protein B
MELVRIVEALLFTATEPLEARQLASLIRKGSMPAEEGAEPSPFSGVTEEEVTAALEELAGSYAGRSFHLQQGSGGWRLGTIPEYAPWVRQVSSEPKPARLSHPALETLAVIAYRQPISRSEIEAIRGVAVGGVLETLLEREVIRVAGRADVPGRPLLYETTPFFLEHFGLRDLSELPNVEELKRMELPKPPAPDNGEQPELIHDAAATAVQD